MSLSPFVSFQSRFVTYLLTYPRTNTGILLTFMGWKQRWGQALKHGLDNKSTLY